jgi:hypothetical protein
MWLAHVNLKGVVLRKPTPDLSILTGAANGSAPRDFGIRIAKDGTWYHNGLPFTRKALVKLFSTVMQRAETGEYLLATPVERGTIEVEDAPFVAVEMVVAGEGEAQTLKFRTNVEDWVTADADHPIWLNVADDHEEPRPYVLVRPGLEALIVRPVFYDLIDLADENPDGSLSVRSGGISHHLGHAEE